MPLINDILGVGGDESNAGEIVGLPERAVKYIKSTLSTAGEALSEQIGSNEQTPDSFKTSAAEKELKEIEARKIWHYELFITDGYINTQSGAWPPDGDNTSIPGWKDPIYIWGFTDIDPNISGNLMTAPKGSIAPAGSPVGNAKFPGPILEAIQGNDLFITVHNRGFFQKLQQVQDDQSLHLHGIRAKTPYDGFPETAGGYGENLRYFWLEEWYEAHGSTAKERDAWWNALTAAQQQSFLKENKPLIKPNQLNQNGGIYSLRSAAQYPEGIGSRLPYGTDEDWTQFTYHIRPMKSGTFMYYCSLAAPEHIQMGLFGALIIGPSDGSKTVYGLGSNTGYDLEYIFVLSEFDPLWHRFIEGDPKIPGFYHADWKPELWFINGRTFPQTLLPFAWNKPDGGSDPEPRYDTYIKVKLKEKFLARWINIGYQEHPMHQHGWHMRIVGSDGTPWVPQRDKFTILIGSGETYDTITTADPVYGVTDPAGSPLSSPATPPGTLKWRQIYPVHDHDDYRDPYHDPVSPTPPGRGNIEPVPPQC